MKTYNVKEVAEILNVNIETVRRWIRKNDLHSTIDSNKGGHIITEDMLNNFLEKTPKYASIAARTVGIKAGIPLTIGLLAGDVSFQKFFNKGNININEEEIVVLVEEKIRKSKLIINEQLKIIDQAQRTISEEKKELDKLYKFVESIRNNNLDRKEDI